MIVTTTHGIEGAKIKEYIGICTGECVLGTGFLSSLNAGLADLVGGKSGSYAGKLRTAKDEAVREMINEAMNRSANAVVGVDIDYTTFGNDIIGVIATGTAVVVDAAAEGVNESDFGSNIVKRKFTIEKSNITNPIQPVSVIFEKDTSLTASIKIKMIDGVGISAVKAILNIKDSFGDEKSTEEIVFDSFEKSIVFDNYESASVEINSEVCPDNFDLISEVNIIIQKYTLDDSSVVEVEKDILEEVVENKMTQESLAEQILFDVNRLDNAAQIYNYLVKNDDFMDSDLCDPAIMKKILSNVTIEPTFGNCKDEVIKLVKKMVG